MLLKIQLQNIVNNKGFWSFLKEPCSSLIYEKMIVCKKGALIYNLY